MCQLFFSKCILFGKALTTVALLLWWQNNRKYEAQSVFSGREWGVGGVRKTKTSWVSLPDGRLRPPALPHQDPCCHVVRYECHIFLCFLWFLCCKVFHSADRLTDRLYESLIVIPLLPLLSVWEAVCCICQMKCQYTPSKTNKQTNKKCLWTDFFVLLLFCKCTVKHIWWPLPVLILFSESIRQCMHLFVFFNCATVAISCLSGGFFKTLYQGY